MKGPLANERFRDVCDIRVGTAGTRGTLVAEMMVEALLGSLGTSPKNTQMLPMVKKATLDARCIRCKVQDFA